MSEQLPTPENKRLSDDELIARAIAERHADPSDKLITDATARMIASQLHGGQSTELYSFASTGAINTHPLLDEIERDINNESLSDQVREWADELSQYVMRRDVQGRTDAVEGWNELWLEDDTLDLASLIERANKLYNRDAQWPAFAEEFTQGELIELWEKTCVGKFDTGFDDEIYDALHVKYDYFNEERADD